MYSVGWCVHIRSRFETLEKARKANETRILSTSRVVPSSIMITYKTGRWLSDEFESTNSRLLLLLIESTEARMYWPSRAKQGTRLSKPMAPLNAIKYLKFNLFD